MRRKFLSKKKINFLTVFLILDVFVILTMFNTTGAVYSSKAIGNTEMEVALYAFSAEQLSQLDKVNGKVIDDSIDISLGDISPGETKYYKFDVYNYLTDEKDNVIATAETNISYNLKIITTTNLPLEYKLYMNQSAYSSNASNILNNASYSTNMITDGYGTFYQVFAVDEQCFKHSKSSVDEYTLVVNFPGEYSDVLYQDLIESIKIQVESKQVLQGDIAETNNLCR